MAAAAAKMKAHVVIYPHAAQGHVTPMLQLAKLLARRGIIITFVNTEHIVSRLLRSQSESGIPLPQEQDLDIRFVGIPDGLPEDHGRTSNIPELVRALEKLARPFAELIHEINHKESEAPVSCIISDVVPAHTQDLALELGIPRIAFWTPSACAASIYMHSSMLVREKIVPIEGGGDELVACIPGIHPIPRSELPHVLTEGGFMLDKMLRNVQKLGDAAWIIINSFQELEGEALEATSLHLQPITTIGPLLPDTFIGQVKSDSESEYRQQSLVNSRHGSAIWPEDDKCLNWLDQQEPSSVLYISFGSIIKAESEQVRELALGLEACQQPFLWVLRPDSRDSGLQEFLEEYTRRTKNRGFVTTWVPQLLVLSHPSVGAFLTHNGWNSTLESICAGVPMLCWPGFFDQFVNARYVVEVWKVGLWMKKRGVRLVNRDEVAKTVRMLLPGNQAQDIRRAAGSLRDAARKTGIAGGTSHRNLEELIEFLSARKTRR